MVTWGIISAAMLFVRSAATFNLLRFLLGAAEAGFFPGIVLYLTYWVPSWRRSSVLAAFLTSTAISGIIGNPLAGVLMKLQGAGGLHGWQWLFLVEGAVPVALGVVTLKLLPNRPREARWLSPALRDALEAELSRDAGDCAAHHHVAELRRALTDARLWLLSVIYFMLIMGLYGFIYWLPTIVAAALPQVSDLGIGLLTAMPYLVGAVAMVMIGRHSDRRGERRWHVATCALVAAAGVSLVAFSHSGAAVLAAFCIAAIGIFSTLGPFWSLSTRFLRGSAESPSSTPSAPSPDSSHLR